MLPKRMPLHFTLLTLSTLLIASVVAILATANYIRGSETAVTIADELMIEVNDKVIIEIDALFKPITTMAERVSELPALADKPEVLTHSSVGYFLKSLTAYPYIYSVYMGFADDDFFQVISIPPGNTRLRDKLDAPDTARFALRRIFLRPDGKRVEIWKFMDAERGIVGSRQNPGVTYRPTGRPWYEEASETDEVIRTAPYPFTSSRSLGITMAKRFDGNVPGVFGVDLALDALSEFLAKQKIGKSGTILLFQGSGELIAHPEVKKTVHEIEQGTSTALIPMTLADLHDPTAQSFYQAFLNQGGSCGPIRFKVGDTLFFGRTTSISEDYLPNSFAAVLAPLEDYTGPLEKNRRDSLIFALIVLALTLPAAYLLSRRVSVKLAMLSEEADKIRQFTLQDDVAITSRIAEVQKLASAFASMKSALRTFGQYVPQTLVRKIVRREMSTKLGGKRQPLTVLFSDVANFTTISESSDPETLMMQISEYFQEIGDTITQGGGTIDKFIGDAVMAFWNAPTSDPHHAKNACAAALSAARATNALNERWKKEGKPVYYTRIGLHTGECIVGNVGSSDRMDYTAMGDVVNMASRLEGLNKHYKTQILVGKDVRDQAGDDFLFRSMGKVVPKGKTEPVEIFELIDTATEKRNGYYSKWETAYTVFNGCDFEQARQLFQDLCDERPHDAPACRFRDRAEEMLQNPPPEDWCGIETFTTK